MTNLVVLWLLWRMLLLLLLLLLEFGRRDRGLVVVVLGVGEERHVNAAVGVEQGWRRRGTCRAVAATPAVTTVAGGGTVVAMRLVKCAIRLDEAFVGKVVVRVAVYVVRVVVHVALLGIPATFEKK